MERSPIHRRGSRTAARALGIALVGTLALAACGNDDGTQARAGVENIGDDGGDASSASGSASATASGDGIGDASSDGGYDYGSDVRAHRLVSEDVCDIVELLGADPVDWDAVDELYTDGEHAVNGDGSVRTLAGFATADDRLHGLDEYYGTATPLDDWVRSGIDGTGTFEGAADAVRAQAVEKGLQNQVLVAWTVHELDSALAAATDGELDPAEGAPHNWDEAWAYYHGAAPGCAPAGTADKRAENFGTTDDDGTALANEAILDAMIQGHAALVDGDLDAATEARDEIVRQVVVTYSQAAIRYATLAEADVADGDLDAAAEHLTEGLAFFRVIEAIVAGAGADVGTLGEVLDPGPVLAGSAETSGGGDEVRSALEPAWETLGITRDQIGELRAS